MTVDTHTRAKPSEELRDAAISLFATDGYAATSIQNIADAAGYSKSSVLYHFASKESLLEAALEPVNLKLEELVESFEQHGSFSGQERITSFVDVLMAYRREAAVIMIQGQSLTDVPVIRHSNAIVARLSAAIFTHNVTVEDRIRIGVGLAGAAFVLVAGHSFLPDEHLPADAEVRAALIAVLEDLFGTD